MSKSIRPNDRNLRNVWRRWSGVFAHVAKGRHASRYMNDEEYEECHLDLQLTLRAEIEACSDEQTKQQLLEMDRLVAPWLNLEAITNADRNLIVQTANRCAEAESFLTGRRARMLGQKHFRISRGMVAFALIVAAVAGCVLYWKDPGSFGFVLTSWHRLRQEVRFNVRQIGTTRLTAYFAVFVVIAGGWIVYGKPRS